MTETVFVKPAAGRRVRVPFGDFALVPDTGMDWPANDPHLHRCLRSGDLVEAKRPENPKAAPDPEIPPSETPIAAGEPPASEQPPPAPAAARRR